MTEDAAGAAAAANGPRGRRITRSGPHRRRSRSEAGPPPARPPADPPRPAAAPGAREPSRPGASPGPDESTRAIEATGSPQPGASSQDRNGTGGGSRPKRARRDGGRGTHHDGGGDGPWRELTGSGRSQVSQAAALRARDADQPTAEDLATAEREVVIQRRNWTPGS